MRVAFLTNIVSPYRRPALERLALTAGWTLRVFVNAATEFDRAWSVDTSGLDVVQSRTLRIRRRVVSREPVRFVQLITLHVPFGLWRDLRRFRPEVIISHELGARSLIAALYARLHRVPLVLWAYQSRISATQGGRLRRLVRRWLLARASAVVGMGTQAREVLRRWGVEDDRIVDAPNAADTDSIRTALRNPALPARAQELKNRVAPGKKLALVAGRLVPLKGITELLAAWSRVDPEQRGEWRLVFVGDGPLQGHLQAAADEGVIHAGHVPVEEMSTWYAAADLLIFPTCGDVWGLVVNEAMAYGVPVLCSVHAGCSDDLIRHGVNGLLFDPTDPECAARSIGEALGRSDLERLGRAARSHVESFTLDGLAEGFRQAVRRAGVTPKSSESAGIEKSLSDPVRW